MAGDHRRADRVAESIREQVATFLRDGAKDPRLVGMITVTAVEVPRDLRSARIYVSIMGSETERAATMEALEGMRGHVRSRLAKTMKLRVAPEVTFKLDESVARAARIETLLSQIRDQGDDAGPKG